jgi:hypothetical protein
MRYTPMKSMLMGCTPFEMHVCEVHTHEMHAHKVQAHERQGS